MSLLSLRPVHGLAPLGPLVLRLIIGFVVFAHGWQKWTSGPDGWLAASWLASMGLPAPTVLAWLVLVVETIGALMVMLGLLTRFWAAGIAIDMIMAITLVKLKIPDAFFGIVAPQGGGAGAELDLSVLAGALALLFLGPGPISLDRMLGIERDSRF